MERSNERDREQEKMENDGEEEITVRWCMSVKVREPGARVHSVNTLPVFSTNSKYRGIHRKWFHIIKKNDD